MVSKYLFIYICYLFILFGLYEVLLCFGWLFCELIVICILLELVFVFFFGLLIIILIYFSLGFGFNFRK